MGAVYTKEQTDFKVWAPTAQEVILNLYRTGSDSEEQAGLLESKPMRRCEQGIWHTAVRRDLAGVYYTYTITANEETHETADIYAKACGVNGRRSMVVDLEQTNPPGWDADRRFARDVRMPVIYEVHVKDFSHDIHSGVREAYRGKFLAFTETGTCCETEAQPTCVAYLKRLGITHVHLLPFFDFGSVDESKMDGSQFNWGYDPMNYNVPEGSYATDPFDGAVRIRECKEMIKALHDAGIAVVMDVVYNHTYSRESWFQYTVPYYYYRLDQKGAFSDGSICGNDTASERSMFRKYMIESVCYWASEYHIDGFRFDLMGLHDVETMNQIRAALDTLPGGEQILMYGEPWSGDYSPMQTGSVPALKEHVDQLHERIAIFCDHTRDSIKGSVFFADEPGFVNGGEALTAAIRSSVCAWCDGAGEFKPKSPGQILSYVSAHDNYTLWDKLIYTLFRNENEGQDQTLNPGKAPDKEAVPGWETSLSIKEKQLILKRNKMAAGIYFTCLGVPFFQAGEEAARTKQGVGDSYQSPPELNQLDWKRMYEHQDLIEYYRGLIQIRKSFSAFYSREKAILEQIRFVEMPLENMVAFRFQGNQDPKDSWSELYIIYNGNEQKTVIDVPKGEWEVLCDGNKTLTKNKAGRTWIVNEYAVTILGKR